MEAHLLTDQELDQAAGGWGPAAVIGGVAGGISYSWNNSNWTPGGFAAAVGFGALGGGFAGWGSRVGSAAYGTFSNAVGTGIGVAGGQAAM